MQFFSLVKERRTFIEQFSADGCIAPWVRGREANKLSECMYG